MEKQFNKDNAKRLIKLATHLEKGKLGHKKFDFTTYNSGEIYDKENKGCGTSGCAIGECPIVFPNEWSFNKRFGFNPVLNGTRIKGGFAGDYQKQGSSDSGMKFFGLSYEEYKLLFIPVFTVNDRDLVNINGTKLNQLLDISRRKTVAKQIRKFVKAKGF